MIDGNDDILAQESIRGHERSGGMSLFFYCPDSETISSNANKGSLKIRITQTGAVDAALIKFDSVYLGTMKGLVETQSPDSFSFTVNTADGLITKQNGDIVTSTCSSNGTGSRNCTFNGLTVDPICVPGNSSNGAAYSSTLANLTSSGVTVNSYDVSGSAQSAEVSVKCTKQGVDANQVVSVYKSLPKRADFVNEYLVNLADDGETITNDTFNVLSSCSRSSAGTYNCTFQSNVFETAPEAEAQTNSGSGGCDSARAYSETTSGFTVITYTDTGVLTDCPVSIRITKKGVDYKMPSFNLFPVSKSVQSVYSFNTFSATCNSNSSGGENNDACSPWIDVATSGKTSTGIYTYNLNNDYKILGCSGGRNNTSPYTCGITYEKGGSVLYARCYDNDTGSTLLDAAHSFSCLLYK